MLVFSKEKCIEDMRTYGATDEEINFRLDSWITMCDGKAVDKLVRRGYPIKKEWCVEITDTHKK